MKKIQKRSIKIIFITFIILMLFTNHIFASKVLNWNKMSAVVMVNGVEKDFDAYTIEGNNYFKLRDIAEAINGTEKNFNVEWDNDIKAINLKSETPYIMPLESTSISKDKKIMPIKSNVKIYKDNEKIELTAYTIAGNNYFKLRDLAKEFNIGIVWNNDTKTIEVLTNKPYFENKIENKKEKIEAPKKEELSIEDEVILLVNKERERYGITPLKRNERLMKTARIKSEDMAMNNYFSHISPKYGSPFDLMKRNNISYLAAGENIALGQRDADSVVKAWMNSPGHRANILNPEFNNIGVGLIKTETGINYWTQMFTN